MASSLSARLSAASRAIRALTIRSARRRKFSMRMMRSVIATAHSSPIVSASTRW